MPVLESYSFGRLVVDGTTYTKDIVIFPDGRILSPWWRKSGHRLTLEDISDLVTTRPRVIIAGTGYSGLMKPAADLEQSLQRNSIQLIVQKTGNAVRTFNQLPEKNKAGLCLHLTC
jgi:hypothetical protein